MTKIQLTSDLLKQTVQSSYSIHSVLKKLNLHSCGNAYRIIKNKIIEFNIDVSHFIKREKNYLKTPIEDILVENSKYKSTNDLKLKLIKLGMLEYKCNNCKITNWLNEHLILQLHHIDGNNSNNILENLVILCPNCHSQTLNYSGRIAEKLIPIPTCQDCRKQIHRGHIRCLKCSNKQREKITWPSTKELIDMKKIHSWHEMEKTLGVCEKTIRKRMKNHPI